MLLDTSGLLCFLHKDEPQHQRAVELIVTTSRTRLTHNYVLAELVALALVRGFSRSIVLSYSLELINNSNVQIVWVDEPLHREAIDLLLARQDKTYSLCDAVSFVLMRRQGIMEALTTDKHFEQEGFTRLLHSAG
ncbi:MULTISPECIES: type II toxin-antitoxin system VapC family toxin [unclassified Nostoc]|uniref:type II toxin-antitoxin system VapC family toxin n=1 Tax=unclassified Nostoc TaxID=2593658 RepID=UPI002AD4EA1F|nr:PIN domain-containing protein [Nostoc sp. DedQUE03]MDZ7975022.1 PIN domain-containing protein [Nostoc sp. DedQUE03]MDZ8047787.1 PIN domain-containing protein [Nostoc sp. DedQUE02]